MYIHFLPRPHRRQPFQCLTISTEWAVSANDPAGAKENWTGDMGSVILSQGRLGCWSPVLKGWPQAPFGFGEVLRAVSARAVAGTS
jgi:hypothetical protein